MRKYLLAGASLLFAAPVLLATPAHADGDVFVGIQHDKDIFIYEQIRVGKFIFADASILINAEKFAESFTLINQSNYNNEACSNCAEKQDYIDDSFNDSSGHISANQAVGNMNNQGSATSIAYDFADIIPPPPDDPDLPDRVPGGFAESQSAIDQRNGISDIVYSGQDGGDDDGGRLTITPSELRAALANGIDLEGQRELDTAGNRIKTENVVFRNADVANSFSGNSGIIHGNQSAGNMNNQANGLSLAVSLADNGVALSEADLGQYTVTHVVEESDATGNDGVGINKAARIGGDAGSFNGNSGIIGFNQTAGNMANQANNVSFSSVGVASVGG